MANTDAILTRLLTSLSLADPTWDTTVGSVTYKIMESVAQELANVNDNSTLLTYGYDVYSKFGTELDAFVNLFGINRQLGTRAIGTVTFGTVGTASQDYDIPLGTQVYANFNSISANVGFNTTSPAILSSGQSSVIVPIIASVAGSFGNLPSQTVTNIGTPLTGINTVVNEYDLTNGTDTETDDQLKQRFFNTAFSNFAGTNNKFLSVALQDPNVTRVNVVESQEVYDENLQVVTTVSGSGTFELGLSTQAKFIVNSGESTATITQGSLQPNVTVTVSSQDPAGIYSGTNIVYDGSNYILDTTTTASGYLTVNYIVSSGTVLLSGTSTASNVSASISGLLNGSKINYGNSISVLTSPVVSGFSVVSSGINVIFSQGIPWNLVVSSGAGVVSSNTITSQNPDAMFVYPQGNELVGLNIGSVDQVLLSNINDYSYIRPSGNTPLKLTIKFSPKTSNAPYTYTGQNIQLQSQYIPLCSRITVTGNNTQLVNPNYVDIFIDGQATSMVSEQAIINTSNTFNNTSTSPFYTGNFITASGGTPTVGDFYIPLTQGPVANFPYQVLSGNGPSTIVFGKYSFPLVLSPTVSGIQVTASGSTSDNRLFTTATGFMSLKVGMVASGSTAAPSNLVGLTVGNYITKLTPGNPNIIEMSNNFTGSVSGTITWVSVAYPVYDNTKTAGSLQDISGIAFKAQDPVGYGDYWLGNLNAQSGSINHDYYVDVVAVDNLSQQSRTSGTDLLVHQGKYRPFIVNICISYIHGYSPDIVNSNIQSVIAQYFSGVGFSGIVNLDSLVQSVYSVTGVASARIATSSDSNTSYGLQETNLDGSIKPGFYTKNIVLSSNELPTLYAVNFFQFGQNSF